MSGYLDLAEYLLIAEAVLGIETILPDGNKRVAYLAMVEFLARNGVEWMPPSVDETVATIESVAAGRFAEQELADWLRSERA